MGKYLLSIVLFLVLISSVMGQVSTTLYTPTNTGLDSSTTGSNLQTKRLSNRMIMVGWDSVLYINSFSSSNSARLISTSDGGSNWSTGLVTNNSGTTSQVLWPYGDSSFLNSFGAGSTGVGNNRKLKKYRKFTEVLYDTITHVAMTGDNTNNSHGGVLLSSGSYLALWATENGTTDTVLLVITNGAPAAGSTWTVVDSAVWSGNKWGDGQQIFSPIPGIDGMIWMDKNDDMYFADSIGGLDTLSTTVTGATLAPTDLGAMPQIGYSIRYVRDSFIVIAYQNGEANLEARPYHLSKAGTGGTSFDTLIPDASAAVLETDANLPPLPSTGSASYICASPCPWLVTVPGTDTVYCFYFYWANQSNLDSADLVCKKSTDKGATWGSRTTVLSADQAKPSNNKTGLFGAPYAKYNNGVTETFLGWSDSMTVAALDSVNIVKVKIGTTIASSPSLPSLGHGPGTVSVGHSPSGRTQGHKP